MSSRRVRDAFETSVTWARPPVSREIKKESTVPPASSPRSARGRSARSDRGAVARRVDGDRPRAGGPLVEGEDDLLGGEGAAHLGRCPPATPRLIVRDRTPSGTTPVGRSPSRDRELAPGAGEERLDLERPAGVIPAELGAEDRRHARRNPGRSIGQLVDNPHPASQDVVDRECELAPSRPRDLDLEMVLAVDQPAQQARLATERDDLGRLGPVTRDEAGGPGPGPRGPPPPRAPCPIRPPAGRPPPPPPGRLSRRAGPAPPPRAHP